MKITELTIENFKGFKGKHSFNFDKNLNFFVGDNNCGKSSVFESIEFLKSGLPQGKSLEEVCNKQSGGHVTVTLKLQGNIKEVIGDFSESKYLSYVFEENGEETILAKRTSQESEVIQGKKTVQINIKKLTLWNPQTSQFENASGLDSVFKTLFETQFVWADTNPEDISDFGSTKICGRLLTNAIGDFFNSQQWKTFEQTHKETFQTGADSLAKRTSQLEKKIEEIIVDQYGLAKVSFNFQLPEPSNFIKSGGINIDDGNDTSSRDKGTGMQRALALALIQVYAEQICKHPEDGNKVKPLFLFLDEPETFLHPNAQSKLLDSLNTISTVQQIFVTTHSPFLLRKYNASNHALYLFSHDAGCNKAKPSSALGMFGKSSPTWGEITYFAYDLCTTEFHNELYGFLQAKAIQTDSKNEKEVEFEKYLVSKGITQTKKWKREKAGVVQSPYDATLQTYIRNYVHHPENRHNDSYKPEELRQSIEEMVKII